MIPGHLRPASAAPPPLLIDTPEAVPDALSELVTETRRRLEAKARENRTTRREGSRARLAELLANEAAAPDFIPPTSVQEAREGAGHLCRVRLRLPKRSGPAWDDLSAEAILAASPPVSAGAQDVFKLLFIVGRLTGEERGYRVIPSTVTFHLPQLLAAGVAEYTPRHLRRLVRELERAGLIDAGAHAANVITENDEKRRMWDGSIWAVKMKPSNCDAYLTPEEWRNEWRDFDSDLKCGRTAKKLMSALKRFREKEKQIYILHLWAVNPNIKSIPLSLERTFEKCQRRSVQDVVYSLPSLADLGGQHLADAISQAAAEIAHHLNDQHSFRYWCSMLWTATKHGLLEAAAAQLQRLVIDLLEWEGLRSPGAVFVARNHSLDIL